MNQVPTRAIIAAALVVAIVVFWLGSHNRTEVEIQSAGRPDENLENSSSFDSVRTPDVPNLERTTSVNEPESLKADQLSKGLDGKNAAASDASQEMDAPDSVSELIPVETRNGGSMATRQPFVLSESVKQECARLAHLAKANCSDHLNAIARLASELRNPAWADATEESIRSIVNSQPGFRVRSLECRSSVCALEVESPTSIFNQKNFQPIASRVSDIDLLFAYEYPSSGVRIKVTSISFQRLD